jgi:hypothetical protein
MLAIIVWQEMLLFKSQGTVRMEGGKVKSGYEANSPFEVLASFFFLLFLAENQRFHPQTFHTKVKKTSSPPTVERELEEFGKAGRGRKS